MQVRGEDNISSPCPLIKSQMTGPNEYAYGGIDEWHVALSTLAAAHILTVPLVPSCHGPQSSP